jgi:CHAT domain-containing protein
MVEVCLEMKNYIAAIEYVDRSKARNLVELIATRDAYPQGEIPSEIRQRLQDLRQTIDQENRRLEQEEEKSRDYTYIAQLRQEFQEKYPYKPLTFDDIQNLLDEETAVLEWYILDDKFLTFTLTAQTLDLWTSSPEDLNKLIDWTNAYLNNYRTNTTQWQNSLPQRIENLSEILHLNDLLNTLFTKFPTCKKLILIPHRYLHLFPIHALPVTVTKGASIAPLQEWFAKGVSYAPNCQLLQQAQNRLRHDFNRLFAISNPTEDLIFADLEVETIRESFPKNQRATLQGQNATKAAFLAKDFTQTHHLYFSCHGAFSPNSPLDSGLQLADDVLTLTEIIGSLNLSQCGLVTLSACETGQVALDTTDEDDDENNVTIIENWLAESTHTAILEAYQKRSRPANPLLSATGEKGGHRSKATPKQASKSFRELIEQATKKNTPQSDSSKPKPPEK